MVEAVKKIQSNLKKINELLKKAQDYTATPLKKKVEKSELVKALSDAGHRQSALDLQNWDQMDDIAKAMCDKMEKVNKPIELDNEANVIFANGKEAPSKKARKFKSGEKQHSKEGQAKRVLGEMGQSTQGYGVRLANSQPNKSPDAYFPEKHAIKQRVNKPKI